MRQLGADPGQVGLAAGLVVLAIDLIASSAILPVLVPAILLQGGMIVSRSLMDAEVGRLGRSQQTGLYFGIFGLTIGLAQTIAPLIGGKLYARNPQRAFWLTGLLGLLPVSLLIFRPQSDEQ